MNIRATESLPAIDSAGATTLAGQLRCLLRADDTVLVGTGAGEPRLLIEALIEAATGLSGPIRVIQVMAGGLERLAQVSGPCLRLHAPVPGPLTRVAIAEGRAELLCLSMNELLESILCGKLRIDVVLAQGSRDTEQRALPGLIADVVIPAWEKARVRAIEINASLPRIMSEAGFNLAEADLVVECDYPPGELPREKEAGFSRRIAEWVVECVPDGATIEMGLGKALAGLPGALIGARRNLAMHTGLVGDWAMQLIEAGCVCRPIKGTAVALGATAMGTGSFYRWADRNPLIAIADSRIAHDPEHLAAQQDFVAINAVLEVDLTGRGNSSVLGGVQVSGIGGGRDFARAGASACASIVVLPATTRSGASAIVPRVEFQTLPQDAITHVVTEFGVARIRGLSGAARARALVAIADPRHRAALLEALP